MPLYFRSRRAATEISRRSFAEGMRLASQGTFAATPKQPMAAERASNCTRLGRFMGNSHPHDQVLRRLSRWQLVVPAAGFEPATNGLQNRCSTPELSRRLALASRHEAVRDV